LSKLIHGNFAFHLQRSFFEENGHLNVPAGYKIECVDLSKWVNEQRQVYLGKRKGKALTAEQTKRLNVIGMVWKNRTHLDNEASWYEQYSEAKHFFDEHGHLNVPSGYLTASGKKLSVWIVRQRKVCISGKLTDEKMSMLKSIGMVFEAHDPWKVGFAHAKEYAEAH